MSERMRSGHVSLIGAGFAIWLAGFGALYGVNAIGCKLDWRSALLFDALSLQRAAAVSTFVLVAAALILLLSVLRRYRISDRSTQSERFLRMVALCGVIAALASTAFASSARTTVRRPIFRISRRPALISR